MASNLPAHVLITGASSGLGAELAQQYASKGHALTLLGRDAKRLQKIAVICRDLGATVETSCCDVRDANAMQAALTHADDQHRIGIVIANAGVGGAAVLARTDGEPAEQIRNVFDVNLLGTINTITPLLPRFVTRRSGRLVLIGSMAAFEGLAEAPSYAASKAAVRIYGHGLRRLLAPHGIAVNIVSPGFIRTPMSASLPMNKPFEWSAERAAQRIIAGISRNEREIVFPWQLRLGAAMANVLPAGAVDRILAYAQSRLEQRP